MTISSKFSEPRPVFWLIPKLTNPLNTVSDALPQPTSVTFTIGELHEQIHAGDIDLSPAYQRGTRECSSRANHWLTVSLAVVWPETKQITLIER